MCQSPGGHLDLAAGGPVPALNSIFVGSGLQEIPILETDSSDVLCPATDSDGDGCFDNDELALGLDPNNPLDWSDFDGSGAIDVADISLIVQVFGMASFFDRTGDGVVSVGDITRVVRDFGLVCG
jgi:hypothetical protein